MMSDDELELEKLGDRKTALFCIVSDTDTTFNFIASMVYTQMMKLPAASCGVSARDSLRSSLVCCDASIGECTLLGFNASALRQKKCVNWSLLRILTPQSAHQTSPPHSASRTPLMSS